MTFSVGRKGRLLRSQLQTSFRTTRRESSRTWKTEGQKNTESRIVDLALSVLDKNLVDPIKGQNPVPSHGLFAAVVSGVGGIVWFGKLVLEDVPGPVCPPGLSHPADPQPRPT